jgi:hypothetical protein
MIIGITEVKAKNQVYRCNISEYSMEWCDNYDIFSVNIDNDIGRGMILYVHKSLAAVEVKMETIFQENLFVRIHTNGQDEMLLGLIYRSDSGTEENNIR